MEVRRLLLVPHPAERMYDLIEGAEHYPAFLPWCSAATILERNDEIVAARVSVQVRGVHFQFVTRNRKRRPTWMGLALAEGPFRRFEGEWKLTPLGPDGCRIDFALRYDFESAMMRRVAGAVFERITSTLVEAFVARADALGSAIPQPVAVGPASIPSAPPPAAVPPDAAVVMPPAAATAVTPGPAAPTSPASTPEPHPASPAPTSSPEGIGP
jgi:ribosome-associated toxin RatA of RatAB toxin-antitoxin module